MSTLLKFELKELRELVKDTNSCVVERKVLVTMALKPPFSGNSKESLKSLLDYKIGLYDEELFGILLGYKNVRILRALGNDSADIDFEVQVDYFVFMPYIGATFKGVVNKKRITHLDVLVHRVLNVVINRPTEELAGKWLGSRVEEGQMVIVRITALDLFGAHPHIRGELVESFKRAAAEKEKDWVIEVPQNLNPMTDMYEKKAGEKSEKVAKNELQRLKNIARAKKVKIPRVGIPVTADKASAAQLATAATVAKASTASLGKFQDKLPKEKEARGKGVHELIPGKERKRKAPVPTPAAEKESNLNLLNSILNKQPKIDMEKAVSRHVNEEQVQRSEEKKTSKPGKGRIKPKGKGNATNFSAKKPKGGQGKRNPKKAPGRKRR